MTISITVELNTARLQGVQQFLDSGVDNARCRIYELPRPANATIAPSSAMLAEITLAKPSGTVGNGQLQLQQLANGMIMYTGIAGWCRFISAEGLTAFDCDAGEGVGAWEVQLAQKQLYAGGDVKLVSAVLG